MTELTSMIAWENLIESGKILGRQAEALRILAENGPMTAQELQQRGSRPGLWKRLSELQKKGYVEVLTLRSCSVTGELSKVWSVKRVNPQFSLSLEGNR